MSETTKLKKTFWGRNWISLIALILSIISLCFSGIRMEPVTFGIDRYNFSIDVLSLLVTLLIGWQVINVISFEKRMKKIVDNEIVKLKKHIEYKSVKSEAGIHLTTGIAFYYTFPLRAYKYFIWGAGLYLDCEDFANCNICLNNMERVLNVIQQDLSENKPTKEEEEKKELNEAIQYIKRHPKYVSIKDRFENIEANRDNILKKNIRK